MSPDAPERRGPMAVRSPGPEDSAVEEADLTSLRKVAVFLEKVNLREWVAIMNDPRRSFWINFWAGLARGIGMVVGAALTGFVLAFFSVGLLKKAFLHAGGLPWIGDEMRAVIGFILKVVRESRVSP